MKNLAAEEGLERAALPALLEAAQHADAAAWEALAAARDPIERAPLVAAWLESIRELREYQSQLTAVTLERSTRSLRESVSVLSAQEQRPAVGEEFTGNGSSRWVVISVTPDHFEPNLYMVRVHCTSGPAHTTRDVYSEDWPLFCTVQGLHRVAR